MRALVAVMLAVFAVGCGTSSATSARARGKGVTVAQFRFDPAIVSVPAGQSVTWSNTDDIEHTITAGGAGAKTGMFDHPFTRGEAFTFRFDRPGSYPYFCDRHNSMTGTVRVI